MGNWSKVVALLAILSVGVAFGGYVLYRSEYVKPRAAIAEERAKIEEQLTQGRAASERMTNESRALEPLYASSLPLNRAQADVQYQIWLTQILEFCNARESKVTVQRLNQQANGATYTHRFLVEGEFSLLDLTQFLYEFYWTPFLHRINTLDVQPQEHTELLKVSIAVDGLAIQYRANPQQPFPLADKLPLSTAPKKQLVSGPFAAYSPMGEMEIFRAVKTGVDVASYARLTALPTITDEDGRTTTSSRWYSATDGRTDSYKVGDRLTYGAFDATVEDIDPDAGIVVLRQNNSGGRLWGVRLGSSLSEAIAIPTVLF